MADDDGFTQYIIGSTDGDGIPLVNPNNPVRWGALAGAIVTSFVAAITAGISGIVLAAREAYLEIITGVTEFFTQRIVLTSGDSLGADTRIIEGVFPTINTAIAEGAAGLWRIDLSEYGIFAYPVAVGVILMTLWVIQYGVTYAREEVF